MTAAPAWVDDGSFIVAKQNGATEMSFPFADEGDTTSFVATQRWRIDARYFKPLASMSKMPPMVPNFGIAYLVAPENPVYVGNGLVEWQRIYASVPVTRTVPKQSVVHTFQYLIGNSILNATKVSPTRYKWEYSLTEFTPLTMGIIFAHGASAYNIQQWANRPVGSLILHEDSECGIYRGQIFYRKSVYVTQPSLATTPAP